MIVIIADDFSGAAEIAGIGWSFGLKAEVQTELDLNSEADLLVVDTDSRSCSPCEAADRIKSFQGHLNSHKTTIDWVYKKTDSVLRGPITAELHALLEIMNTPKALLIPVNPSKGRIIRDGRYLINGEPLNKTDFANDAEYPAVSSDVLELLGVSSKAAGLLSLGQTIPNEGIWLGQAESSNDLSVWATLLDNKTIPAGGAEFFSAILQRRRPSVNISVVEEMPIRQRNLFIFGSRSAYSQNILLQARKCGRVICGFSGDLFACLEGNSSPVQQWADAVIAACKDNDCVIAAIDQPSIRDAALSHKLKGVTAEMIHKVLMENNSPLQLYIEGGATASAIVRRMEWKRFTVINQLAAGVVQMFTKSRDNYSLTIKPGSYQWPESIIRPVLKFDNSAKV